MADLEIIADETESMKDFGLTKPANLWLDGWRRLRRNKMAFISLIIVVIYILITVLAPILPVHPYDQQVLEHQFLPPSFRTAGDLAYAKKERFVKAMARRRGGVVAPKDQADLDQLKRDVDTNKVHRRHYWLGTDNLGRDLLSRLIFGGRISILVGIIGSITSVVLGIVLGSIAGYKGGSIDRLIVAVVEIIYSLPYMLVVIIFMSLFGQHVVNLFVAIAIVSWLVEARMVRGQVISLKNSEFVEASRSMGAGTGHIIVRHLIPNTMNIMVVFATLRIPGFITQESFLSFLGLGVSAPLASWGTLISDGVNSMELYPWLLIFPALSMAIFLFAMNFLGDGLRDALDPQSKNRE